MSVRRLLVIAFAVVSPVLAACGTSPTGVDDEPTPPPAPTDSTGIGGEGWPWG